MSRCDLELVLASTGPWSPGQTIDGLVGVQVDAPCRTRGLTVALLWRTHGRGNKTHRVVAEEVLFAGEWQAGERSAHPFSFTVPNGPFSYTGTLLDVEWVVRATADIPWAFDPKAEAVVDIRPGEGGDGPADLGPVAAPPIGIAPTARAAVGLAFVAIGGLVGCSLSLGACFGVATGDPSSAGFLLTALFPLVFSVVGAFLMWEMVRPAIARRRFGAVLVDAPREASPGDDLPVTIRVRPRRDTPVEFLDVALMGEEIVTSGSGNNRRTHRHPLPGDTKVLRERIVIPGGRDTTYEATLTVPPDAPLSFGAKDNAVRWSVVVTIDVPGVLDVEERRSLVIRPR